MTTNISSIKNCFVLGFVLGFARSICLVFVEVPGTVTTICQTQVTYVCYAELKVIDLDILTHNTGLKKVKLLTNIDYLPILSTNMSQHSTLLPK